MAESRAIPGALFALVLTIGAVCFWRARSGAAGSGILVHEVVGDLLDEGRWEVVAARSDVAPHEAVICPSLEYHLDGADVPSLVLPPPASLRTVLGDVPGTRWLSARAGVDHSALEEHAEELKGHVLHFVIRVNGEPRFEGDVLLERVGKSPGTEWLDAGGDLGLALSSGDRLELSTRLVGPAGAEVVPPFAIDAGFCALQLERRRHVERGCSSPELPNIVLVVMDTQRADRLSAYGYERETSPNLERLAERGLLFEEAYSTASWTWPATASILTGLQPQEHGVLGTESSFLADTLHTLPEVLQGAGYTTAAFSTSIAIVPSRNFDQGFETFECAEHKALDSRFIMPAVHEWLDAIGDTRFFLYLHLADPHAPQDPLPEGRRRFAPAVPNDFSPWTIVEVARRLLDNAGHTATGEVDTERAISNRDQGWINDLYDACVWSGDHWIGSVLERIDALGLSERTVFVFTSDHGEELFEHGLAAHGHTLHRELLHVPLILAGPGVPRGERVATVVSNRHLAATLARLAGADMDGVDLLATPYSAEDPVLYSTTRGWWNGRRDQTILGMRSGDRILHHAPAGAPWGAQEPAPDGGWQLLDARTHEVLPADELPAHALRTELKERFRALEARRTTPAIEAGGASLERLRALGYVDG